jgi:hypothetical protein
MFEMWYLYYWSGTFHNSNSHKENHFKLLKEGHKVPIMVNPKYLVLMSQYLIR